MDPAKLKVVELRAELAQRGLDTKGNKPVLVDRLRKALDDESKSPSAEKIPVDLEEASDAPQKEISEKVTESTRTLPPRTPGRSSRSSLSLSTPTKMSTRKTAASPSSKHMSPIKPQNIEKRLEALPTISETASEKALITEEDQGLPLSEKEEENGKGLSEPLQNESHNLVSVKSPDIDEKNESEDRKSVETIDAGETKMCTVESTENKVNDEDTVVPSEEMDSRSETSISTSVDEKQELPEVQQKDEVKPKESSKPDDIRENDSQNVECDNDANVLEDNNKVADICREPEDTEVTEVTEDKQINDDVVNVNDMQKVEDIPEEKEDIEEHKETHEWQDAQKQEEEKEPEDLQEQEQKDKPEKEEAELKEAEEMEQDNPEAANQDTDDKLIKEESQQPDTSEKEFSEEETKQAIQENEQDVEMSEIKKEAKVDNNVPETEQRTDRKRKRSPSPLEEQAKSPIIQQTEEEPEINDSTVTLSWYDSDLNLVIDKEQFLSATPMHNDGFCYVWAGARASYGVTTGKVYYEAKITEECPINIQNEEHPHLLRVGWSVPHTSLQLGEEKLSFGFDGTGKKVTENVFIDYGTPFNKDDIIGCYLDMTDESNVIMSYTVNGKSLEDAFTVSKEELGEKALFPHILSKNCKFSCNFGQEDPWCGEILDGYVPIGTAATENLVSGPQRPEKKEDCEIILMCGLPAAGKTFWALQHAEKYPEKKYNILGIHSLLEKMTIMGASRKQQYPGRWEDLVNKCTQAVNKLQEVAASRRRNYILDQTNVYLTAQRRKMKNFSGYQRKAIVVVPTDEEFKSRTAKREAAEGKDLPDAAIMEMKAHFTAPVTGDLFDTVEWVELNEEEGKKVIEAYNKEGRDAGFGPQHANKRPRFEKPDSNKDNKDTREQRPNRDNRESRDNRDHRDRRPIYTDRNRNSSWRGGSNMGGRRDRPRGGHPRHMGGGGYGSVWRGARSGPALPPPHRNDRRGGLNDRRTGGDRNRTGSRQGGSWGPMNSNYQGSQSSGWGQGNWSSGQSGWSQGGWGQQSQQQQQQQWGGSWKGYGQGAYNQSNYNQGYGNGNWNNSWNQQYYNQYWGQQQQSGQTTTTTTAASGQAVSTTDSTVAHSDNSRAAYSYPQEWQEYNAQSYSYSSDDVRGQPSHQQK